MSDLLKQVGRILGRSASAVRIAAAGESYYRKRDTPKSERRVVVGPVRALSDPLAMLGHPARGRTGRGVRVRV